MTVPMHVALVPRGVNVDHAQVAQVAAALSVQIARDLTPLWNISATVSAFVSPGDVPVGYSPIYIEDASMLPAGTSGVHLDRRNQPYALIEYDDDWSLHASHELLEMLVDPSANLAHPGPLLAQAVALNLPAEQVRYLVEVSDPVQDAQFGYQINGVLVSNFVTPQFYSSAAASGVRCDYQGALTGPLQVLINGYISWLNMQGDVAQFRNFAGPNGVAQPQIVHLSSSAEFQSVLASEGLRAAVDRVTGKPDLLASLPDERRMEFARRRHAERQAAEAHAALLHVEIEHMRAEPNSV